MQKTWVRSLSWEDPLEKEKATHASILAWRIPWTVSMGLQSQTQLSNFHFHFSFPGGSVVKESACQYRRHGFDPWVRKIPWRRKSSPVFLPGKPHGQRSLVGYSHGVAKSRTWLKWLFNKKIQDSMPNHEWWWALLRARRPRDVAGGHQWVHPPQVLLPITSVYCHHSALLCPLIKSGLHSWQVLAHRC